MITFFSIIFSLILCLSSHPLFMVAVLIVMAILNSFISMKIFISYWFSIIIILGLIGGMMILFIYSTSLVANEKFIFSSLFVPIFMLILLKPLLISSTEMMKILNLEEIYSSQYSMIIFILVMILIMLNFVMKIIFDPLIFLKSFYYEFSIKK